jgi:membrane associated rhomboid family serine protease
MAIFASDSIASGAHLGGLVAGLACAAIVKLGYTLRRV